MENASKALIITGSILISILLISFAIIMFNKSKVSSQQASDTTKAIEAGAQAGAINIQEQLEIKK